MSAGSPAGQLRQVGLSCHWAGAWPGLPPALSSRRGLASAAGHLGSALGPRTAPDVALTQGQRAEPGGRLMWRGCGELALEEVLKGQSR